MVYSITFITTCILILTLFFNACDLITEPERKINTAAVPPQVSTLNFEHLKSGQHVDGILRILFDPSNVDFEVSHIGLLIDEKEVDDRYPGQFLTLNTREFEEGEHKISIALYQKNKNHGLLNLLSSASIYYETNIVFDQTPPSGVKLSGKILSDNIAFLEWSTSTNENFYAYRILRLSGSTFPDTLEVIYDKSVTSFYDSTLTGIYGTGYEYSVEVATDQEFKFTSWSNSDTIYYGNPPNDYGNIFNFHLDEMLYNSYSSEFYLLTERKLLALNTDDYLINKQVDLSNISYRSCFTISNDFSTVYIFDAKSNTIDIINTSDFSNLRSFTLDIPFSESVNQIDIFYINSEKLLLLTQNKIYLINISSGSILETIDFAGSFSIKISLNKDNKLIVYSYTPDGTNLSIRDLSSNEMPLLIEKSCSFYSDIIIAGEDPNLYAWNNSEIEILDLNNLNIIQTLEGTNITGIYIDKSSIYIGESKYFIFENKALEGQKIKCLDINSHLLQMEFSAVNIYYPLEMFSTTTEIIVKSFGTKSPILVIPK